ncbi:site-specific integrase [Bacteroides sp. 519]|uniref:site-specific integrase n=1 Tax=Bacteroides sp. 519 TaxID=2302937 RepID=UPI0013D8C288|nr:site-specific integrase [Bacteroides sp. 519]NDV58874.1 recombinase [Bacteroides sp. 519]
MNLTDYVLEVVESYRRLGCTRTAETYLSTLRSMLYYHQEDAPIKDIFNRTWLTGYQDYLVSTGLSRNSIVFYLARIRSLYNKAVQKELINYQPGLFEGVQTRSEPTYKRAIRAKTLKFICQADFSKYPCLDFARDMFMLSLYLQGISFIDLAYLRKTNIKGDGSIIYQRHKTRSTVTVAVDNLAWRIIEKYKEQTARSPYLLPIIKNPGRDERKQYETALRAQNRRLKKVARYLGIKDNLTSYVSRHSWATVAYHEGVATSVISQAMGHQSEKVTHVYLKSFDNTTLLKANDTVIKAIFGKLAYSQVQRVTRAQPEYRLRETSR